MFCSKPCKPERGVKFRLGFILWKNVATTANSVAGPRLYQNNKKIRLINSISLYFSSNQSVYCYKTKAEIQIS